MYPKTLVFLLVAICAIAGCEDSSNDAEDQSGDSDSDSDSDTDSDSDSDSDSDTDADTDSDSDSDTDTDSGSPVNVDIDFDSLANHETVDSQFDTYAIFSSEAGNVVRTIDYGSTYNTSEPNIICTYGSVSECTGDIYIDFTLPAYDLTFHMVGAGNTGQVAQVRVFQDGSETAVESLTGTGSDFTPIQVDLSTYPSTTRIELFNVTDNYGLGWDDVSFTVYE